MNIAKLVIAIVLSIVLCNCSRPESTSGKREVEKSEGLSKKHEVEKSEEPSRTHQEIREELAKLAYEECRKFKGGSRSECLEYAGEKAKIDPKSFEDKPWAD